MSLRHGKDPADKFKDPPPKEGDKPPPPPPPRLLYDDIVELQLHPEKLITRIIERTYGPIVRYTEVPERYQHCVLGYETRNIGSLPPDELDKLAGTPSNVIIDPSRPQILAVELARMYLSGGNLFCLHGDVFQPRFGANFRGIPGCGKTHILAAFALAVKALLAEKLADVRKMIRSVIDIKFKEATRRLANKEGGRYCIDIEESDSGEGGAGFQLSAESEAQMSDARKTAMRKAADGVIKDIRLEQDPKAWFEAEMNSLSERLINYRTQPTDFLWLGFDQLCELCTQGTEEDRRTALLALERARLVFVDDVNPKESAERTEILLTLFERRYEIGRPGTFITTNLETKEFVKNDIVQKRLESRCAEMFLEIDFEGSEDWRKKVNQRRVMIARQYLEGKFPKPGAS